MKRPAFQVYDGLHDGEEVAQERAAYLISKGESASALLERDMPAIAYLCEPWVPEGLHLTVGRPKIGKSTLVRQKLAAIASGAKLFD